MRNHTTPLKWQLSAGGNRAPTVTPGTSVQSQTFNLQGLPGRIDEMMLNAIALNVEVRTSIDQPSAGTTAIAGDKLYKIVDSIRVRSEVLGEIAPLQHTRGAVLGHVYQVVGAGYRYPQIYPRDIPTTDQDNIRHLVYRFPLSQEFTRKPHHHAIWMPLFEGGELEVRIAASTVLDGDSTAAVTEATTTIRAWIDYLPMPEALVPRPFQFREYITPGNSTQHILRNVGGQSGLRGVKSGCRLAMLAQLTDATGIGLSGSDGADNITRTDMPWRHQNSHDIPQADYYNLLQMMRHPAWAGRNLTATEVPFWPYAASGAPDLTTTDAAAEAHNAAQAYIVPYVMPGLDMELTKLQKINGDLVVNHAYTSTPSGSSRFVSLEILDYTDEMKATIMGLMGKDPKTHALMKKTLNKQDPRGVEPRKLDALPDKIVFVG